MYSRFHGLGFVEVAAAAPAIGPIGIPVAIGAGVAWVAKKIFGSPGEADSAIADFRAYPTMEKALQLQADLQATLDKVPTGDLGPFGAFQIKPLGDYLAEVGAWIAANSVPNSPMNYYQDAPEGDSADPLDIGTPEYPDVIQAVPLAISTPIVVDVEEPYEPEITVLPNDEQFPTVEKAGDSTFFPVILPPMLPGGGSSGGSSSGGGSNPYLNPATYGFLYRFLPHGSEDPNGCNCPSEGPNYMAWIVAAVCAVWAVGQHPERRYKRRKSKQAAAETPKAAA